MSEPSGGGATTDARPSHAEKRRLSSDPGGLLETTARVVELAGRSNRASRLAALRAGFEARTGSFCPDDPWFEERSRAFWCDALTRGRLGREVQAELTAEQARWLDPVERAHRGLFRAEGRLLVDVWSGVELLPTLMDEPSQAELGASAGQLFDARVAGTDDPAVIALLPGAIFHPRQALDAIETVLRAARAASLSTHDTLDALLRMDRKLRSLARVKAEYAYRPQALFERAAAALPVRVMPKGRT